MRSTMIAGNRIMGVQEEVQLREQVRWLPDLKQQVSIGKKSGQGCLRDFALTLTDGTGGEIFNVI